MAARSEAAGQTSGRSPASENRSVRTEAGVQLASNADFFVNAVALSMGCFRKKIGVSHSQRKSKGHRNVLVFRLSNKSRRILRYRASRFKGLCRLALSALLSSFAMPTKPVKVIDRLFGCPIRPFRELRSLWSLGR